MGLYGIVWDLMGFNGVLGGFHGWRGGIEGMYPKKGQKRDFEPPQKGDLGSKCPTFGFLWPHMGRFGVFFGVPP